MLPKCKAHVESFDGQTKCLYFFDWKWELIILMRNIILFEIKWILMFKKNSIVNLLKIKNLWKSK